MAEPGRRARVDRSAAPIDDFGHGSTLYSDPVIGADEQSEPLRRPCLNSR